MAHFAELDADNTVIRVIVVRNEDIMIDGVEVESKGIDFCKSLFGQGTSWKQTSYTNSFRGTYASQGMKYDTTLDKFVSPTE